MMKGRSGSDKLLFVLSVDTEEEFDWSGDFPQQNCNVDNIHHLPEFHQFCQSLGVRPTYLVDYPVAINPESASILRCIQATGCAEIGAHLHPWCNPPLEGNNSEFESHVLNLPENLIRHKLSALIEAIEQNLCVSPKVFRTGRWGIDSKVLGILMDYGFAVDSSVYPYYENQYFSCLGSHDVPYWPDGSDPGLPGSQRSIYEIPITSGFNRANFASWGRLHNMMSSDWLRWTRMVGFAWHTRLLRKLFLSPELTSLQDMIALVRAALHSGNPIIHMFLHSSTLLEERGEYNQHKIGRGELYDSIRSIVDFLRSSREVEFCTLSEAAKLLQQETLNGV